MVSGSVTEPLAQLNVNPAPLSVATMTAPCPPHVPAGTRSIASYRPLWQPATRSSATSAPSFVRITSLPLGAPRGFARPRRRGADRHRNQQDRRRKQKRKAGQPSAAVPPDGQREALGEEHGRHDAGNPHQSGERALEPALLIGGAAPRHEPLHRRIREAEQPAQ